MQLVVLLLFSGSRNEKVNNFPNVDIAVDMYHVRVANMTPLPCHYDNSCPLGDSCLVYALSLDHPSAGVSVGDWNLECTTAQPRYM